MMSLRKFMHPRNKYKEEPDFKKLAEIYPEFRKHMITDLLGKLRYNFKNEESLRVLAKILLKHDFGIDVEIPAEKLVPTLPLRLNYVLWIEDLLKHARLGEAEQIHGIDIGAGAVCIYPLLCAKINRWKMTGTEINKSSVDYARKNIENNCLDRLITVIQVSDDSTILQEALANTTEIYSFTMCNPPFFTNIESKKKDKRLPPRNASTGNANELHVQGGERSFVTRLIDDSLILKDRIKIYTTMLGQKSSIAYFRSELKRRGISNATWTEFCQGHTKRWGLAWTFLSKEIVDLTIAPVIRTRRDSTGSKKTKDRSNEIVFPLEDKYASLDELISAVKQWIQELKIKAEELDLADDEFNVWTCRLKAYEDSWSHARRKRRMARQLEALAKKSCPDNSLLDTPCLDNSTDASLDNSTSPSPSKSSEPFLECTIIIGEVEIGDSESENDDDNDDDFVRLCFIFEGGRGGKQAFETFRQYIINKLNLREYLMNQSKSKSTKRRRKKGRAIDRSS